MKDLLTPLTMALLAIAFGLHVAAHRHDPPTTVNVDLPGACTKAVSDDPPSAGPGESS